MNPPIRVGDEVVFWDGTGRRLTECELGILDLGEELLPAKGRRFHTVYDGPPPPPRPSLLVQEALKLAVDRGVPVAEVLGALGRP